MKKLFLYLLTIVVVFSNFTITFAADNETTENIISVLGIDLPYEYDENRIATKAELIYLLINAANEEFGVDGEELIFSDVKLDYWAHDAIVSARMNGYVLGCGDGTFGIDDAVASDVAANIAMKILGFNNIEGDYIYNFARIYNELLKGVEYTDNITVKQAMRIVENMLDSSFVKISSVSIGENSYEVVENQTFLEYKHRISKERGIVTGTPFAILGEPNTTPNSRDVIINNIRYKLSYDRAYDYLGYEVIYYVQEDDDGTYTVIFVEPVDNNEVSRITSRSLVDINRNGSKIELKYENSKGKEQKITFPITCEFVYNGKTAHFQMSYVESLINDKDGEIQIVETPNSCFVSVTAYTIISVRAVDAKKGTIYGKNGEAVNVELEEENGFNGVYKNGVRISLADIKTDDVLQITETNGNAYKIVVLNYQLHGTVGAVEQNFSVTIDGAEYEISNHFKTNVLKKKTIFVGMKTTFWFNEYGQIIDFDDENISRDGEFLYFADTAKTGTALNSKYILRVVTLDAKMVDYELAEKVRINDSIVMEDEALFNSLSANGVPDRGIVFVKLNKDGKISELHLNGSDKIQLDANEALRKNKNSRFFLAGSNDSCFPEIYVGNDTVFLQIPTTGSARSVFADSANYKTIKGSDLLPTENYTVSAYNFNDYNVPEIILIHKSVDTATALNDADMMVVEGFGEILDDSGNHFRTVNGYMAGAYTQVKYESDSAITYSSNGTNKKIKSGDVVMFGFDNDNVAFTCKYIRNVEDDFGIMSAPEGKQDGDSFILGNVISNDGTFVRIALDGSEMVCMTRNDAKYYITVYNTTRKNSSLGTMNDLLPETPVLIRMHYSTVRDIIVKQ